MAIKKYNPTEKCGDWVLGQPKKDVMDFEESEAASAVNEGYLVEVGAEKPKTEAPAKK